MDLKHPKVAQMLKTWSLSCAIYWEVVEPLGDGAE
jgi:hypothetical protein